MENKKTKDFDKREYARNQIAAFLQSYSKGENQVSGLLNQINNDRSFESFELNKNKRVILENCLALFKSQKFKEYIKKEKEIYGILEQDNVSRETLRENLYKISKLSQELTDRLSNVIFGNVRKIYDMSSKTSARMLNNIKTAQGTVEKDVTFFPSQNSQPQVFRYPSGDTISIEYLGRLEYNMQSKVSANEFLYKHHVEKTGTDAFSLDVYSNLNLLQLSEDKEYARMVFAHLLNTKNVTEANADGYIGELSTPQDCELEPGDERDIPGFYRFQISSKYALEYNGERIEAIRSYNQQQKKKKNVELSTKNVGFEHD